MPNTLDEETRKQRQFEVHQMGNGTDERCGPASSSKKLKNSSWSVPSLRFFILTCYAGTFKSSTRIKVSLSSEKVIRFNENMRLSWVCSRSIAINSDPTFRGDSETLQGFYRETYAVYRWRQKWKILLKKADWLQSLEVGKIYIQS